jgi:hypothetical protein
MNRKNMIAAMTVKLLWLRFFYWRIIHELVNIKTEGQWKKD